ncbi:MAG: hypothetical protein AB1414_01280 [bacterium]
MSLEITKEETIQTIPTGDQEIPEEIPIHQHLGTDSLEVFRKKLKTVATVPTGEPKNFFEQFVLYESGVTYRLYVYLGNTWCYVALT